MVFQLNDQTGAPVDVELKVRVIGWGLYRWTVTTADGRSFDMENSDGDAFDGTRRIIAGKQPNELTPLQENAVGRLRKELNNLFNSAND